MRYPIGKRIEGKVVSLAEYGAFIELEPGHRGADPRLRDLVDEADQAPVEGGVGRRHGRAVVLDVDERERKISLGMKQIEPNPWSVIEEKYPINTKVSGTIRNITNFGIFVALKRASFTFTRSPTSINR